MSRLPPQPGERIDRSAPVGFTFDGKRVAALAGDTIASALIAGGLLATEDSDGFLFHLVLEMRNHPRLHVRHEPQHGAMQRSASTSSSIRP